MKRFILISVLAVISTFLVMAQTTVTGKITDKTNGEQLPGVTIYVKGNTGTGTISELTGAYTITIPSNETNPILIFQFIGYEKKEVSVNGKSILNIALGWDETQLDEIVVTSFGIKRERKALNYALQDVKSDEISDTKEQNVVNALRGKVAGVQITASSGSPGASSQILIRGANSVNADANNQPLFIVDGMPIDNSSSFGGGNRAMDINPDDIESMVVLKGPAASALYGLEAANGAIVITTKSGSEGKTLITFGSNIGISRAMGSPDIQNKYMQGTGGYYDEETSSSWGPAFGVGIPVYDNVGDFLQTGVTQKYDLSVSGGSSNTTYMVSGNYTDQTGVVPGEDYLRYGALLKGSIKVSDNFKLNGSSNLVFTENSRMPFGFMSSMYRWPVSRDMSMYQQPSGEKEWLVATAPGQEYTKNYLENPYWWIDYNSRKDVVNRNMSQVSAVWDITDNINMSYRVGTDLTSQHYKSITAPQSAGSKTAYEGAIYESERNVQKTNSTFMTTYQKQFTHKLFVSALVGQSVQMDYVRSTATTAQKYKNPDLNSINNMDKENVSVSQSTVRRRVIGAYGDIKLDYDHMMYLTITGRNDWSSSLPADNNSFFYPSFTGGFIASELFHSDLVSFLKLRGNWAKVGKDAPAERLTPVLKPTDVIGGGFKYDYYAGNPFLKPETTVSWETGFDLRLFKGNTTIDLTYYNMRSHDQIVQSRVSTASGWVMQVFNAGSIENKGVEMFITQKILDSDNLKWNVNVNYSFNRSKLFELPSFVSRYPVTQGQMISAAIPTSLLNEPLLAISGTTYLRNTEGQLVVDEKGYPRVGTFATDEDGNYIEDSEGYYSTDLTDVYLGNREPDAIVGLTNNFTYKNVDLSFLFDIRMGGDVINATNAVMTSAGMSGTINDYRNEVMVVDAVVEQEDGTFVQNEEPVVLDRTYFNRYISVGDNFVEDASWVRLRNVNIAYTMPTTNIKGVEKIRFALAGNNLLLFTKYSGGDPETNYGGAGVGGTGTMGLDYFNTPSVKSINFSIKATF